MDKMSADDALFAWVPSSRAAKAIQSQSLRDLSSKEGGLVCLCGFDHIVRAFQLIVQLEMYHPDDLTLVGVVGLGHPAWGRIHMFSFQPTESSTVCKIVTCPSLEALSRFRDMIGSNSDTQ